MQTIDVHEAEIHLEALIDAAAKGSSFIIAKEGKPLVCVTAVFPPNADVPKRIFGRLAGRMSVPDDFDLMYEDEIRAMFENDGKL